MKKIDKEQLGGAIQHVSDKFKGAQLCYSDSAILSEFLCILENTKEKIRFIEDKVIVSILGGTNSGKSTTLNFLFAEEVSSVSPEAPHDRLSTIMIHEKSDFKHDLIDFGPRLVKTHSIDHLQDTMIICGVDFDSIELANQVNSRKIFNFSDLVIFLCTPEKYADEVFFSYLKEAFDLEKQILVVVNKSSLLKDQEIKDIRHDLEKKLDELGLDSVGILFCDAKNAFEGSLPSGESETLKKIIFEDLYKDKNRIKLREINSDLKNISLRLNHLYSAGLKDETEAGVFRTGLQELQLKVTERIDRLFSDLEVKFNQKLENLATEVSQRNSYLRMTSFLKKITKSIFSFSTSEAEEEDLANYIYSLFYPDYAEFYNTFGTFASNSPFKPILPEQLKEHFISRILEELKTVDTELKSNVTGDIENAFGMIIKKDMSALLTTGVLIMMFSLNGLILTEVLISLFGGFFVSETGRQKTIALVKKIKSDTVKSLRMKIEFIFFEELNRLYDVLDERMINLRPLKDAMMTKGEIELLRETIDQMIDEP